MDLGIKVFDVEISMGNLSNKRNCVRLAFRRPPDREIRQALHGLTTRYGWKIEEGNREDNADYFLTGDFSVTCTGTDSDKAGNAIAGQLKDVYGMKVCLAQFVRIDSSSTRFERNVEVLDLNAHI